MARVNVKFGGVKQSIVSILKSMGTNPFLFRDIGIFVKKRIYSFTKRGIFLKTGEKLAPLSQATVNYRHDYQAAGLPTGSLFKPNRSNLTLTGQMLESMEQVTDIKKHTVTIKVPPTQRSGDDKTNAEVAELNRKGDASKNRPPRPFIGLDLKGQERVRMMVIRELRRRLSRFR